MNSFLIIHVKYNHDVFVGTTQKNIVRQLRKRKISFTNFDVCIDHFTNGSLKQDSDIIPTLQGNRLEILLRQTSSVIFIFHSSDKETAVVSGKLPETTKTGFEKHLTISKQLLTHFKSKKILFIFQTQNTHIGIINRVILRWELTRFFLFTDVLNIFKKRILFSIDNERLPGYILKKNRKKLRRAFTWMEF